MALLARNAIDAVLDDLAPDDRLRRGVEDALARGADARVLLGDALVANASPLSEKALEAVDRVLERERLPDEALGRPLDDGTQLDGPGGTRVVVWKGDITTLAVDAVVNAANEQALGCFQPAHRCIDNVLHRAAGPRLREECREAVAAREGRLLPAGAPPLLTGAGHLPARHVLHVTGPALPRGAREATEEERTALAACYSGCLDAAEKAGLASVTFCCISTGLFGYPARDAALVALGTVAEWLKARASTSTASVRTVVFDVFLASDEALYRELAPKFFGAPVSTATPAAARAAALLREADAVLVCAGAGMSASPGAGTAVYTSATDFAAAYGHCSHLRRLGYRTAYDCVGLLSDRRASEEVKWGFWAQHAHNMRWRWPPSGAYDAVLRLVGERDHFFYTSNVDGAFERAGADPERVYTPQGDWAWYQCASPCRADAVWPSRELVDRLVALAGEDGALPPGTAPRCRHCGGATLPGVRGGGWFLHTPHEAGAERFGAWLRRVTAGAKSVAVLEIGAGFNTPSVTRFPMEQIVRDYPRASLVRVNPESADVPRDLGARAVGLGAGWDVALPLLCEK